MEEGGSESSGVSSYEFKENKGEEINNKKEKCGRLTKMAVSWFLT